MSFVTTSFMADQFLSCVVKEIEKQLASDCSPYLVWAHQQFPWIQDTFPSRKFKVLAELMSDEFGIPLLDSGFLRNRMIAYWNYLGLIGPRCPNKSNRPVGIQKQLNDEVKLLDYWDKILEASINFCYERAQFYDELAKQGKIVAPDFQQPHPVAPQYQPTPSHPISSQPVSHAPVPHTPLQPKSEPIPQPQATRPTTSTQPQTTSQTTYQAPYPQVKPEPTPQTAAHSRSHTIIRISASQLQLPKPEAIFPEPPMHPVLPPTPQSQPVNSEVERPRVPTPRPQRRKNQPPPPHVDNSPCTNPYPHFCHKTKQWTNPQLGPPSQPAPRPTSHKTPPQSTQPTPPSSIPRPTSEQQSPKPKITPKSLSRHQTSQLPPEAWPFHLQSASTPTSPVKNEHQGVSDSKPTTPKAQPSSNPRPTSSAYVVPPPKPASGAPVLVAVKSEPSFYDIPQASRKHRMPSTHEEFEESNEKIGTGRKKARC